MSTQHPDARDGDLEQGEEDPRPRATKMMKHSDFTIGGEFLMGSRRWRCTDIGTRTVAAIRLDHDGDPSWYNGPPYAVAEMSLDEYDIQGCERPERRTEGRRREFVNTQHARTDAKTVSTQIRSDHGSIYFNEIVIVGGERFQVNVRSTSEYNRDQSYASIERWDGSEWKNVHVMFSGAMQTRAPKGGDPSPEVADFKTDRDELIRVALAVSGKGEP